MKRAVIFLCSLFVLFTKTFSQGDSVPFQVAMPLQVLAVEAKAVNKNVQLIWNVSGNEDAKSFEVERAEDGENFKKIGGKLSLGRTGNESYEFVDALPGQNIAFIYRIKVIARDGSFVYSDVRAVKINDDIIRCKLKQNPVRNSIDVEVISVEACNIRVSLITGYGQKLSSEITKLNAGINNLSYSSQNLLPGLHRLVFETGSERKVISFVKE